MCANLCFEFETPKRLAQSSDMTLSRNVTTAKEIEMGHQLDDPVRCFFHAPASFFACCTSSHVAFSVVCFWNKGQAIFAVCVHESLASDVLLMVTQSVTGEKISYTLQNRDMLFPVHGPGHPPRPPMVFMGGHRAYPGMLVYPPQQVPS